MVEGRGVAEKQGVSLAQGIGHIPRIPLPHFWTGVGEKGRGCFLFFVPENYKTPFRALQSPAVVII